MMFCGLNEPAVQLRRERRGPADNERGVEEALEQRGEEGRGDHLLLRERLTVLATGTQDRISLSPEAGE